MSQLTISKALRILVLLAIVAAATSFFFPDVWVATAEPSGDYERVVWMETPYSQQNQNLCNSAANEVCVEYCTISSGQIQGSGDLCCAVLVDSHRYRCSSYR